MSEAAKYAVLLDEMIAQLSYDGALNLLTHALGEHLAKNRPAKRNLMIELDTVVVILESHVGLAGRYGTTDDAPPLTQVP